MDSCNKCVYLWNYYQTSGHCVFFFDLPQIQQLVKLFVCQTPFLIKYLYKYKYLYNNLFLLCWNRSSSCFCKFGIPSFIARFYFGFNVKTLVYSELSSLVVRGKRVLQLQSYSLAPPCGLGEALRVNYPALLMFHLIGLISSFFFQFVFLTSEN